VPYPPLFIEVPVPGPEIKHSCICVLEVSILVFSTNVFLLDFGTVQTVIFCFPFYSIFDNQSLACLHIATND
jgi:hypothetical protein